MGELVQFSMTEDFCSWCEQGDKPEYLDQDGVLVSLTGKPGYLCHAQDDFWWPCVPSIRQAALAARDKELEEVRAGHQVVRVIFDGLLNHESGRFIECEDEDGKSINAGEWKMLPDGLWELRITIDEAQLAALREENERLEQEKSEQMRKVVDLRARCSAQDKQLGDLRARIARLEGMLTQFVWPDYEQGGKVKDQGWLRLKARELFPELRRQALAGEKEEG